MSIFIACTIPRDSIIRIREAMRSYQDILSVSVPQEKWHCTLLYLGTPMLSQEVLTSLMKPIRQLFHPIVQILSLGQGQQQHQLWATIQSSKVLTDIRYTLLERVERANIKTPSHEQEFIPHITVGTIEQNTTSIGIPDTPTKTSFSLHELTIFQSIPNDPKKPYEKLGIIPITP